MKYIQNFVDLLPIDEKNVSQSEKIVLQCSGSWSSSMGYVPIILRTYTLDQFIIAHSDSLAAEYLALLILKTVAEQGSNSLTMRHFQKQNDMNFTIGFHCIGWTNQDISIMRIKTEAEADYRYADAEFTSNLNAEEEALRDLLRYMFSNREIDQVRLQDLIDLIDSLVHGTIESLEMIFAKLSRSVLNPQIHLLHALFAGDLNNVLRYIPAYALKSLKTFGLIINERVSDNSHSNNLELSEWNQKIILNNERRKDYKENK